MWCNGLMRMRNDLSRTPFQDAITPCARALVLGSCADNCASSQKSGKMDNGQADRTRCATDQDPISFVETSNLHQCTMRGQIPNRHGGRCSEIKMSRHWHCQRGLHDRMLRIG